MHYVNYIMQIRFSAFNSIRKCRLHTCIFFLITRKEINRKNNNYEKRQKELEKNLYNLITKSDGIEEFGWINEEEFCVWVYYEYLKEFMENIANMFGFGIFDDGGFQANMQSTGVCINLEDITGMDDIDLKELFPIEKFRH